MNNLRDKLAFRNSGLRIPCVTQPCSRRPEPKKRKQYSKDAWSRGVRVGPACAKFSWAGAKPKVSLHLRGPRRQVRMLIWLKRWPAMSNWTNLCDVSSVLQPWANEYVMRHGGGATRQTPPYRVPCDIARFRSRSQCGGTVTLFGMNLTSDEFNSLDVLYFPFVYAGVTGARSRRSDEALLPPRRPHHLWALSNAWESHSDWPTSFTSSFLRQFNHTTGYHAGRSTYP